VLCSARTAGKSDSPCPSQTTSSYALDLYTFCWFSTSSSVNLGLYLGSQEIRACTLTNTVPSCSVNTTSTGSSINGTVTFTPSAPGLQGSTPLWLNVAFETPNTPTADIFSGGIWFIGPSYDTKLPNVMLSTTTQIAWQYVSNTSATLFFLQGPALMLEQTILTSFATEFSYSYAIGGTSVRGAVDLSSSTGGLSPCGSQVNSNVKLYLLITAYICVPPNTCSQMACYAAVNSN